MRGKHVAFFNIQSPTHINPSLSIVSVLVRRGYRVTYVSSERFAARLSALGAEVVPGPAYVWEIAGLKNYRTEGQNEEHASSHVDFAARTIQSVSPFYRRNKPDLIICDKEAFAGQILAEQLSVPTVTFYINFMFDKDHPSLSEVASSLGRVDDLFWSFGIRKTDFIFEKNPELNVFLYAKEFQLSKLADDETCLYASRCAGEHPYAGSWKCSPAIERSVVLVSASTSYVQGPQYFEMCLKAFSDMRWHVILAIGDSNDPSLFKTLPPHCEIFQNAPLIRALSQVDLLISFGGMATAMEALYHGVPQILITKDYPELELYANNLASLGLGLHIRGKDISSERISRSVAEIMNDSQIFSAVRKYSTLVKRGLGAEEVVNRLEEYLN